MDHHVSPQSSLRGQSFTTLSAGDLVPAVRPQVSLQLSSSVEGFTADVAEERPVSVRVDLLVFFHFSRS